MVLASWLDWRGTGWYYLAAGKRLLRTFWAKFGWAHVSIIDHKLYRFLAAITIIGILGAFQYIGRNWRALPKDGWVLFWLVLLGIWGMTLPRGVIYIFMPNSLLPVVGYTYPSIIPSVLFLVIGWFELMRNLENWFSLPAKIQYLAYILGFLLLDVISLRSITLFYSGKWA